jgi:5-methylthioadenosine/S-adenosylhomocysteine deaminase
LLEDKVVAAHCVWLNDEEIDLLKKRRVGVVHNPQSNLKLASGIAPLSQFIRRGVKTAIGTDGAASNNDLDMLEELQTAALIHKAREKDPTVAQAKEILEIATLGGAVVLGIDSFTGSITPGKYGDLVLFRLGAPNTYPIYNPYSYLVYAAKASDISYVFSKGKLIYRDGEFLTLDYKKAVKEIIELAKSLR